MVSLNCSQNRIYLSHHHIKLVLIVLDSKHHGHSLTNLHNAAHFTGIGTLANLEKAHVGVMVC